MNEVVQFLKENPVQFLATIGLDGKPKNRPFMFAGAMNEKLWFCTNIEKDVYHELQKNPALEVTVASPQFAWLRLNGKARFVDDRAAKEMCLEMPIVKNIYGDASNPIFTVFYIDEAQATLADFSGNPPRHYSF